MICSLFIYEVRIWMSLTQNRECRSRCRLSINENVYGDKAGSIFIIYTFDSLINFNEKFITKSNIGKPVKQCAYAIFK